MNSELQQLDLKYEHSSILCIIYIFFANIIFISTHIATCVISLFGNKLILHCLIYFPEQLVISKSSIYIDH